MTDQMHDLLERAGMKWRDSLGPDPDLSTMLPPPPEHHRHHRWVLLAAAALVVVLGGTAGTIALINGRPGASPNADHGGSSASCAGPGLTAEPKPLGKTSLGGVRRGTTVTIYGWFFLTDCYDTGQQGAPPLVSRVTLYLKHGAARITLGVAHPHGELGKFTARVKIPADAPIGRATIREHNSDLPGVGSVRLRVLPAP